jgi:malonate transporter
MILDGNVAGAYPERPSEDRGKSSRTGAVSMTSTLTILLPIFALIGLGFGARRRNVLDAGAAGVLNRFVVWLALPALLFDIMAHSSWAALWQPAFIATFGLATAIVFLAVLAARMRAGRHIADASVDAIAASYSNTAYVGLPLCLVAFGAGSQLEATIATIIVVCVLFSVAVVLVEVGLQGERPSPRGVLAAFGRSLRNPIVLPPFVGAVFAGAGLHVPDSVETFLRLIGQAATPCALVALGLFLADRPAGRRDERHVPIVLAAMKLLAMPALAWWLAHAVFHLPTGLANCAVLLAALPTGTGPFMLAEFYRREAGVTSATTLASTVASLATLTVLLASLR